jgi:hypothetical protein
MTRAFHILAFVLISVVAWVDVTRPLPQRGPLDPTAQLIELMTEAGFVYLDASPLSRAENILSFKRKNCSATTDIIFLPTLYRISDNALEKIANATGTTSFIYDGEVVPGLSAFVLIPRYYWRKLLVTINLRSPQLWQSIALAVLVPKGCEAAPVDWMKLIHT